MRLIQGALQPGRRIWARSCGFALPETPLLASMQTHVPAIESDGTVMTSRVGKSNGLRTDRGPVHGRLSGFGLKVESRWLSSSRAIRRRGATVFGASAEVEFA